MTALPGVHSVGYCNTVSGEPGPSGWSLDNLTPPPYDGLAAPTGTNACRSVQLAVIAAVDDENQYKNHGAYVSAATKALKATGIAVSEACQSCIINQFARSVPQEEMKPCCGL